MKKTALLLTLLLVSILIFYYVIEPDKLKRKSFWEESVLPLIKKDKNSLGAIIEFPLGGNWSYIVGLEKEGSNLTQEDFYKNYNELFNSYVISSLESQVYQDVDVIVGKNKPIELLLETHNGESKIYLKFRQIQGDWKLYWMGNSYY